MAAPRSRGLQSMLRSPRIQVAGVLILFAALVLSSQLLLLAAFAFSAALILVPFAPLLVMGFYTAALALSVPINDTPLEIAGFKMYAADFVVYLVACVGIYCVWVAVSNRNQPLFSGPRLDRRIVALVVLNFVWGVVEVLNGVVFNQLEPRDAAGDFRRLYIYMLAILVPIGLPLGLPLLRRMPYVFAVGGAGAVMFGLYRMATGLLYHSFTSHVDSPRILGDNELMALAFLLAYCIAVLASKANPGKKLVALALGGVAVCFMLISGWRYGIALSFGVPLITLGVMGIMKRIRFGRLALRAVPVALVVVLGAVLVFGIFRETITYVWQMRQAQQQLFQQDARPAAYAAAWQEFVPNPVMGTGLGDQLVYFFVTSSGEMLGREGTTHNMYIDVLYQTGLVGLALFLALHAVFTWHFLRSARKLPPNLHRIAAALFVGYMAMMGLFCMEPSYVAAVVATFLTMGLLLKILRYADETM